MITREYRCLKCESVEEYLEENNRSLTRPCEDYECGGVAKRIISAPSVSSGRNGSDDTEYYPGSSDIGILFFRRRENHTKDFN